MFSHVTTKVRNTASFRDLKGLTAGHSLSSTTEVDFFSSITVAILHEQQMQVKVIPWLI